MNARDALRATQHAGNGSGPPGRWDVTFGAKGTLVLPEAAKLDDIAGHCAWLTSVFNLDPAHPITAGKREGLHGPEGHAVMHRAGERPIRFEPVGRINTPVKLIETLSWRLGRTDGAVRAFKADHCREIAHVIRMLCDATESMTDEQEAEAIVGTFMQSAEAVEGHTTYGSSGQRYEAAVALRRAVDEVTGRAIGPARYLIDTETGEYVIAVAELQDAGRRHTGSSLPRGWLDGRMEAAAWVRITIQGYGQDGRAGRKGPHGRVFAYRGHLSAGVDQESVNT